MNDGGSKAKKDAKFYRTPTDYVLGVKCYNSLQSSVSMLVIRNARVGIDIKRPRYCHQIWNDRGSGKSYNYQLWRPVPPDGFTALSDVPNFKTSVSNDRNQWGSDQIWCVANKYVERSIISGCDWTDAGTKSNTDGSIWYISDTQFIVGNASHRKPNRAVYKVKGKYIR